jgi:hypothetical protein
LRAATSDLLDEVDASRFHLLASARLANALHAMAKKKIVATVGLDCCFSSSVQSR